MNGLYVFRLVMALLIGFGACYVWLEPETTITAQLAPLKPGNQPKGPLHDQPQNQY
ncbi:MAG TPA: hypothetical protein VJM53_07510 [Burkholderiales bacterium]|jgi:hypothetical protein|nr:hypothetical protein [Burkholderiales bacterium]